MKRQVPHDNTTRFYLYIFIGIVFVLFLATSVVRGVQLLERRTFKEDEYTVLVEDGKNAQVVSIANWKNRKRVVKITVENVPKKFGEGKLFEKSMNLGIPLDGFIVQSESTQENLFTARNAMELILGSSPIETKRVSPLDFLKIQRILSSTSEDEIVQMKYNYEDFISKRIDPGELYNLLKRESIISEKISLAIINASGENGLAKDVAEMFEKVGYYIITVDSTDQQDPTRIILANPDANFYYSFLLGVEEELTNKQSLEDVKIILGRKVRQSGL